ELEASAAQRVDGGGHLRQHGRVPEGVCGDEVAEADPRGAGGESGGEGPTLEGVPLGRGGSDQGGPWPHPGGTGGSGPPRPREDRVERHTELREEQAEPHADVAVSRHGGTLP